MTTATVDRPNPLNLPSGLASGDQPFLYWTSGTRHTSFLDADRRIAPVTLVTATRLNFEDAAMGHLDSLYRTARRMTGNSQDAEDLVQETFLRAYNAWNRFDPEGNVRAWLFRILVNTFISRYRKNSSAPRMTSLEDAEEFFIYNQIDRQREEHLLPSAEEEALSTLVEDDVKRAIEELPEHYRVTVVLADVEGFSYREIASILGVKIGTVMSRLARGRRILQQRLWNYAAEQGIVAARAGGNDGLS